MNTKQLRQKILDLAIHGKLIAQDEKWVVSSLKEILSLKSGDGIKVREQKGQGAYPIFGGNGINGYYDAFNVDKNTLIIGRVGFYCGCIHVTESKAWVTDNALIVIPKISINTKFLFYLLTSLDLRKTSNSTAQPVVSGRGIYPIEVELPSISEQHRIVTEVEKWMQLIDILESSADDLKCVVEKAKAKILDLAIQGKLVEKEGEREGKRLGEVVENINGLWKGKKEPFVNVGVIRNANFTKDFKLDYSNIEYIDVEEKAFRKRCLYNGDLIVEKSGGSENNPVGRAILFEGESEKYSFSNFTMVLRIKNKELVYSRFLYYVLLNYYKKGVMKQMQTQTTGLHNLILDTYLLLPISLPPLTEQRRIVTKVEELFAELDRIEEMVR